MLNYTCKYTFRGAMIYVLYRMTYILIVLVWTLYLIKDLSLKYIFVSSSSAAPLDGPSINLRSLLVSSWRADTSPVVVGRADDVPSLFHFRRLSKRLQTLLTTAQSVMSSSSVSKRRPTFSRSCESNDLINNRTLLVSSTIWSNVDISVNHFSNSWRSTNIFLPFSGISTHSMSSLFDNRCESSKPYFSRSHSNSDQFCQFIYTSNTSAWMLWVTPRENLDIRISSRMSLINIWALKASR